MPGADVVAFVRLLTVAAIPVVFGITLHEVGHGWMARRFGDRTAELLGRLTLNPLKHIDPVGTVIVPLMMAWLGGFLFGWAKPVPINPGAMRNPKRAMIAVAAAGPGANLLMALMWAVTLHLAGPIGEVSPGAQDFLIRMASFGIFFNILIGLFNLLPIPPLDGGRVLRGVLPEQLGRRLDVIEPYGLIIVIALLALGVLDQVLGPPLTVVQDAVLAVVGVKDN
jgi:Zn-dependent protease